MSLGIPLALPDDVLDALADLIALRVSEQLRQDQQPQQQYFNTDEAAEYMRFPKSRVYDLRALGRLTPMPGSNKPLVFSRAELDRFLNEGGSK